MKLGKQCAIMPMGESYVVGSVVIGFDRDMVGLVWKALPDDLVGASVPGTLLTAEQRERVAECEDAPTIFLHTLNPEALDRIALQASSLAAEWRAYLEKEGSASEAADQS